MQGQQIHADGHKIYKANHQDSDQHLYGPGSSNQENCSIDNKGDDQDVDEILPANRTGKIKGMEEVRHEGRGRFREAVLLINMFRYFIVAEKQQMQGA